MAVADIEPADILAPLRKIERRGNHETARRALQFTGQTLRYAIATARLRSDPSRDLKGALTAPRVRHHPAILDPERLGELLRAIDGYNGRPSTKLALQIAPHVFVRPGELRHADWSEFNLDEARWAIPAQRMKMRREHVVPLSKQVVNLLKAGPRIEAERASSSRQAAGNRLCENTLNLALTAHGLWAG